MCADMFAFGDCMYVREPIVAFNSQVAFVSFVYRQSPLRRSQRLFLFLVFLLQLFFAFSASLFGSDRVRNRKLGRTRIVELLLRRFDEFVSFLESLQRVAQKLNQLGMRELFELRCVFRIWCCVHPALLAEFTRDFSPSFY